MNCYASATSFLHTPAIPSYIHVLIPYIHLLYIMLLLLKVLLRTTLLCAKVDIMFWRTCVLYFSHLCVLVSCISVTCVYFLNNRVISFSSVSVHLSFFFATICLNPVAHVDLQFCTKRFDAPYLDISLDCSSL